MFDVAVPFGGRKHTGFGKELGEEALESYLQSKSVWVDLTSTVPQSGLLSATATSDRTYLKFDGDALAGR